MITDAEVRNFFIEVFEGMQDDPRRIFRFDNDIPQCVIDALQNLTAASLALLARYAAGEEFAAVKLADAVRRDLSRSASVIVTSDPVVTINEHSGAWVPER